MLGKEKSNGLDFMLVSFGETSGWRRGLFNDESRSVHMLF